MDDITYWLRIAVIAAAVGLVIAAVVWGVRKIRRVSSTVSALKNDLVLRRELLAQTPKSVSAMTTVYLPRIQHDFPDFNYPDFRQRAENTLQDILLSISAGRVDTLPDAPSDLAAQARMHIADIARWGRTEHYSDITIHRTEISRYEKRPGLCVITLQSAVGYQYSLTENGELIGGSRERLTQTKYNMELHYVQDVSALTGEYATAVGVVCPNCGAPVTLLGAKKCDYCGSGILPIEDRVWKINRYEEV